jgi:hypothetical protein
LSIQERQLKEHQAALWALVHHHLQEVKLKVVVCLDKNPPQVLQHHQLEDLVNLKHLMVVLSLDSQLKVQTVPLMLDPFSQGVHLDLHQAFLANNQKMMKMQNPPKAHCSVVKLNKNQQINKQVLLDRIWVREL